MRLTRPVGMALLYMPCLWGLTLSGGLTLGSMLLFGFGALAMRSFGCIINDVWDRGFDKHIPRTQGRPLAAGTLSIRQALALALLTLIMGGAVFTALTPWAKVLSLLALTLACLYPLAKRVMAWPQLMLGLTFNMGLPIAYSHATGGAPSPTLGWLYGAAVLWTLAYDTLYALADAPGDALLGLGNAAITACRAPKTFIALCYLGMLLALSLGHPPTHPAAYGALAGIYAAVALSICSWNTTPPIKAYPQFKHNVYLGVGVWGYLSLA
jgi:4-hydroxybenzoate polyprenyltransferase